MFYSSFTFLPPQFNKQEKFKVMLALFFWGGASKKNHPTFLPKMGFRSLKGVS
jgi:hypothetical protein